jgi:hypothetical protein
MRKEKIWDAVKASLKADGIALGDKEKAVRSLSQCCADRICIAVYLEFTQ